MINELCNKQILSLAHQGAGVQEIAEHLGVEEAMVDLVLSAHEQRDESRDITDDQLAALRQRAYALAMQSEDIGVSARMTQYLIDRDKPVKQIGQSPIVMINNAILQANEQFKKLQEEYK